MLEEARAALSASLADRWKRNCKPEFELEVTLPAPSESDWKRPANNVHVYKFQKTLYEKGWFTEKELKILRNGLVVECFNETQCSPHSIEKVVLGYVVTSRKEDMARSGCFEVAFFDTEYPRSYSTNWLIKPVGTTLIDSMRQFAAVTTDSWNVPFFERSTL